ncbi:MAG TPA: DUF6184 family natural product biosynthesis lipoprotein [Polyangiaceae bacterium]|jgi:hypothetical protein|nr:DUF6184 family natural product biosynthesis lipoprotein [Polyangiaceae bacterium]
MNTMRFRLTPSTALVIGLSLAACEKRTEPSRDTDRAPYQEPVREARPSTDTTPTDRTTTDRTTAERGTLDRTTDPAHPTPAATAQNASAVSSITQARCEREARCNNIGNGKKFESRDECVTKTRADWRDDLNARECPNGVVSSQLASCVSQIKDENCSNVVEKLETVLACRTADLCKRG